MPCLNTELHELLYCQACDDYCNHAVQSLVIWDLCLSQTVHIHQLEMVQNRFIRFIADFRGFCSKTEARESLSIESLQVRKKMLRKNLFCKIMASDIQVQHSRQLNIEYYYKQEMLAWSLFMLICCTNNFLLLIKVVFHFCA